MLYITVLSRLARLGEDMLDTICDTPDLQLFGDELWTVVCSYALGFPFAENDLFKYRITLSAGIDI